MIAQEFALLAPERIVSLSLLVTHAGGKTARGKPSDVIRLLHSMFFLRTRHEMIVAAMNRIYHSKTMSDLNSPLYKRLYDLHADRLATRQPLTFYGVLGHFQAVFTHRVDDERLKQIRDAPYPKLVMCGTEDQLVNPINSKILAEKLQPAEYHIIQDAGHGLISEKPEEVNPILQSFIDRASKQRKQRKQSESQSATSVTQQ
jgi:pimeloyl-ACP methyl ester carboxylesterase